jgi:hypothetical protein
MFSIVVLSLTGNRLQQQFLPLVEASRVGRLLAAAQRHRKKPGDLKSRTRQA